MTAMTVSRTWETAPEFRAEWDDEVLTVEPERPKFVIVSSGERPKPLLAVRAYAERAVTLLVRTKQYDDGTWFATADGFDGPWADGASEPEARLELVDVIYEWAILKIEERDKDIPTVPGTFDLNTI